MKVAQKKKMKLMILLFLIVQKEIVKILEREKKKSFLVEKAVTIETRKFKKKMKSIIRLHVFVIVQREILQKKIQIWRQES